MSQSSGDQRFIYLQVTGLNGSEECSSPTPVCDISSADESVEGVSSAGKKVLSEAELRAKERLDAAASALHEVFTESNAIHSCDKILTI